MVIILLAFSGQLAWGVENQFFNIYLYNNISPDPRPIAWMVAASAITATVTTILMGTLSDRSNSRWGRRKPFILIGYLAWAIFTALFPAAAVFKPVTLAIGMAILFDCVMTYFGSMANDAALNAYITDVTTNENRGRVMGGVQILTWVALLIVYGGAGLIIDSLGIVNLFYIISGLVFVLGLIGSVIIRDVPHSGSPRKTYWGQVMEGFRWKNLIENREFFLILIGISLWSIAQNIFFPYLMIYLTHFLELDPTSSTITIAGSILIGGIAAAWPLGLLIDRVGRKPVALISIVLELIGLVLFSLARSVIPLMITGILWLIPLTAWTIATGAWNKDHFPDDRRGQFAGFYLLFWVMIPMILGPLTGGWLGTHYGIPSIINGQQGIIPTPILFQVAAAAMLLAGIPLLFVKEKRN
jgi:MFS family permease